MHFFANIRTLLNNCKQSTQGISVRTIQEMTNALVKALPEFLGDEQLTYEDAIKYFVTARPNVETVAKGVILKQVTPTRLRIIQVFLDMDNVPVCNQFGAPYGRMLLVKNLDDELQRAFDNSNLIVVE